MPNGLLTGYKRRGRRRQRISRVERTKCCRTDSELLSLFLFPVSAPSLLLQGFEEARAVRGTPRVRPAAPSTCFPFCASRHTGVGICSPPCSSSLVSTSCPTVGCKILPCYLFVLLVHIRCCSYLCHCPFAFSVLQGPCPCVIPRNRIFGSLS